MRAALLEILRAPRTLDTLCLEKVSTSGDDTETGILRSPDGRSFEIRQAIPRFTDLDDTGQAQTRDAFGFKWGRLDSYDSEASRERVSQWCLERYGFPSATAWASHFERFDRVIDVGCGGGCPPVCG
jgi:uncharacterized protein YbaR (Trm112 family)